MVDPPRRMWPTMDYLFFLFFLSLHLHQAHARHRIYKGQNEEYGCMNGQIEAQKDTDWALPWTFRVRGFAKSGYRCSYWQLKQSCFFSWNEFCFIHSFQHDPRPKTSRIRSDMYLAQVSHNLFTQSSLVSQREAPLVKHLTHATLKLLSWSHALLYLLNNRT